MDINRTMVSVLLAGTPVQVVPEISLPRCLVVVVKGEERGMKNLLYIMYAPVCGKMVPVNI